MVWCGWVQRHDFFNANKHKFPRDNFGKIRDFIIDNLEMNDNFEINEIEQIYYHGLLSYY